MGGIANAPPRIVLVEDILSDATGSSRALAEAGYGDVHVHHTALAALAELETGTPRIVVLDQLLLGPGSLALTRRLRARKDGGSLYVVVVVTGERELASLVPALGNGVDDIVLKPVRSAELVARLRAAEKKLACESRLRSRIQELEAATGAPVADAPPTPTHVPPPPAMTSPPPAPPVAPAAWDELDAHLASTFRDFFTRPVAILTHDAPSPVGSAVEIRMSEPTSEIEIAITLFVDDASSESLARVLLGDADAEAKEALVLESANIAMGSLKTALAEHELSFTGGIPYATTLAEVQVAMTNAAQQRRMTFVAGDATLEVWVRAESRKNVERDVAELREGMVVAADVRDGDGNVLLRSGTRLTVTTAEWLTKLAGKLHVVVSDVSAVA